MAAGYNGLESGIPVIASAAMVAVVTIRGHDAGSLGFGATYAAAAILGNVAFWAVIAILPMFFEFFATVYYSSQRKERRQACHNPVLLPRGKLKPPKGACYYTLAYYLLGKKPMTEPELVNKIHLLYIVCGLVAVALAFLP